MKPPEEVKRKIVGDWLKKADIDLDLAKHLLEEDVAFPGALAFHSQQAAEKYLKAFLSWHQVYFPKSHDLEKILSLVGTVDEELADSLKNIIILTPYGVELRYPGDRPEVSKAEARQTVELAEIVRDAIKKNLPRL